MAYIQNVVSIDHSIIMLDYHSHWKFLNLSQGTKRRIDAMAAFECLSQDGTVAYARNRRAILQIDLKGQKPPVPIFESELWLASSIRLSSDKSNLLVVWDKRKEFANCAIGTINLSNSNEVKRLQLDDEEFCSGSKPLHFGDCFLTGFDELLRSTTRIRSAITGEVIWDFEGNATIPLNHVDRFVTFDFLSIPDRVETILCDYSGNEIVRHTHGFRLFLIRPCEQGNCYAVYTSKDWCIISSSDGKILASGEGISIILFSHNGRWGVRLYGEGRKNQKVDFFQIFDDHVEMIFHGERVKGILTPGLVSNEGDFIVLYEAGTSGSFQVIRVDRKLLPTEL